MSYTVLRDSVKKFVGVRRQSDQAVVPKDTANADYQVFLAWNDLQSPPLDISDGTLTLDEKRAVKAASLSEAVKSFVEARYPQHKQRTLSFIRIGATGSVAAQIDSIWSWIQDCIAYYYQKEDAIVLADDESELNAITWDFAALAASDPQIALRDVMGISSSSSP
jgi:hypothetical protein